MVNAAAAGYVVEVKGFWGLCSVISLAYIHLIAEQSSACPSKGVVYRGAYHI